MQKDNLRHLNNLQVNEISSGNLVSKNEKFTSDFYSLTRNRFFNVPTLFRQLSKKIIQVILIPNINNTRMETFEIDYSEPNYVINVIRNAIRVSKAFLIE